MKYEYDRNVFIKELRLGMRLMGWIVLCHLCKIDELFGDMADATGCLLGHKTSAQHKAMLRWYAMALGGTYSMDEVVASQA